MLYRSVDLSRNQLRCLGPTVRYLVCVVELNLDDNSLEQLPQETSSLALLEVMSLRNNSISLDCISCNFQPKPPSLYVPR